MVYGSHSLECEPEGRILVITVDPSVRLFSTQQLGNEYQILTAEDCDAGLKALLSGVGKIHAVLLDLRVPDLDDIAFLQTVRSYPLLAYIPVIVLSGHASPEQESTCLENGADDYISMPVHDNVLRSRILKHANRQALSSPLNALEIDDLTKVYNKKAFFHHAKVFLSAHTPEHYDIVISDIDQFKLINTIYGEEAANRLLQKLAAYIQAHSVEGLCARYGSDRLVWLQESNEEALEKLLDGFEAISPIPDAIVRCGVYAHLGRELSIIRMCDNALFALKSIKTGSKEIIAYYDAPLSQRHYKEQFYVARFRSALKNNEFSVVYQPKYDPHTNRVVGAEALVRWKNPDGSVNMPGDFLSVFESNGMIAQLDEYIFRRVCQQQRQWQDIGLPLFPISVNISRNSMHQKDRAAVYSAIAREYNIDCRFVPIEITETTATDSLTIQKNAEAFRREGFPLHMDDFGSEHSSLQTLNVLDFDVVKLDKGLIDFIGDKSGEMILTYIMALSGELGLRTVAEGVETKQQLDFLVENGCDQIQGFYFSKPLPPEEFIVKASDSQSSAVSASPVKESPYILSRTSHFEKMMTQRMLPRIPGGFFIYEDTEEERIIYSNAYLWQLFGCGDEAEFMEHVHGSFRGIVCPEELDRVEESIQHQISGSSDDMDYVEYSIIRKDGAKVPVVDYGHLERTGKTDLFYVFIYRKDK